MAAKATQDLYDKACEAVERSNYAYAVELLREVLRRNPAHPDARVALRGTERRALQERGKSLGYWLGMPFAILLATLKSGAAGREKKLEIWEDVLRTYPDSFTALVNAGQAAWKLGYPEEAANTFKDAQRIKPKAKKLLRALVNVLVELKRSHDALPYAEILEKLMPRDKDIQREVRNLQASGHMQTTGMAEAESFRDLLRDKDTADELEAAGHMDVTRDDLHSRVQVVEAEVAADPMNPAKILNLAQLYIKTDQIAKARAMLMGKHKEMPENYEIRVQLGDLQRTVYEQALEAARSEAEGAGSDSEAATKLADLTDRYHRFVVKEYEWRLSQHPTDRAVQLELGKAFYASGRLNDAIAIFQDTGRDARLGLESARMLGRCFMDKGQGDLAMEQFELALTMHPEMDFEGKTLRYSHAGALEELGKVDEALAIYKVIYGRDINFMDVATKVDTLSAT
jgi:tetratricopeptide (TPR) repeat protein